MDAITTAIGNLRLTPLEGVQPGDGLYATHSGELNVSGFRFRVYQLNTGERVIDAGDVEEFFGGLADGAEFGEPVG